MQLFNQSTLVILLEVAKLCFSLSKFMLHLAHGMEQAQYAAEVEEISSLALIVSNVIRLIFIIKGQCDLQLEWGEQLKLIQKRRAVFIRIWN